jgi:XisH protein
LFGFGEDGVESEPCAEFVEILNSLYRILLNQIDPQRDLYLAISEATYGDIFDEPIGKLAIAVNGDSKL